VKKRILDMLSAIDLSRNISRKDIFSLLVKEIVGMSEDEIEKSIRKMLPLSNKTRPPGAKGSVEFFLLCMGPAGCMVCVDTCRERTSGEVIKLVNDGDPWWDGTPYVDPMQTPCILCEDIPCALACPTGALEMPDSVRVISLGKAGIDVDTCITSPSNPCTKCADKCPEDIQAIKTGMNGWVMVSSYLCVGCGQCVDTCPVNPSAIRIYAYNREMLQE
jgi:ferredoxin-type protein NapG